MISFELSEEQRMIRDTVAAFANDEIRPAAREADETGTIPPALIAKSWELGLVRGAIPEQFGGYGDQRSAVTGAIVGEELAFGDLSTALHMLAPRLLAYPVLEMGTDEQRAQFLKLFGTDNFVAASAALMEPRFDFDPAALETVARRDGASYVLSGAKCCVPLAGDASTLLVYAASDPEAVGVDGFILARDTPGLRIGGPEQNMGIKGLGTFEVTREDCRAGPETRLGGEKGINFTRLVSLARIAMASMAVGVSRAAFEYARTYAKDRKAFGVPIATKQAVAFMLAEMAIEVDAMRLLVWEAAARLDKGGPRLYSGASGRDVVA